MIKIVVGRGRDKATQRIDIADPTVSREHCWLTDNGDGSFTLENKSQLGTYVDGRRILKTRVTRDSVIQLSETTKVKVADLLPLPVPPTPKPEPKPQPSPYPQPAPQPHPKPYPQPAPQPTPGPQQPTFSVQPLEVIWLQYSRQLHALQDRQHKLGLLVRIPMICSGLGGVLAAVLPDEFRIIGVFLSVVSIVTMIMGFVQQSNFKFAQEKEALDTWLQNNYSCPNPQCHHFVGNIPYNVLRQNKKCGYCGCRYTSDADA